jgi:hypothetical protein
VLYRRRRKRRRRRRKRGRRRSPVRRRGIGRFFDQYFNNKNGNFVIGHVYQENPPGFRMVQ